MFRFPEILAARNDGKLFKFPSDHRDEDMSKLKVTRTDVARLECPLIIQTQKHIGNERLFYGFRDANRTIISSSTCHSASHHIGFRLFFCLPSAANWEGCKLNLN